MMILGCSYKYLGQLSLSVVPPQPGFLCIHEFNSSIFIVFRSLHKSGSVQFKPMLVKCLLYLDDQKKTEWFLRMKITYDQFYIVSNLTKNKAINRRNHIFYFIVLPLVLCAQQTHFTNVKFVGYKELGSHTYFSFKEIKAFF